MKDNIISIGDLIESLPEGEKDKEVLKEVVKKYWSILETLKGYIHRSKEPYTLFTAFHKAGSQYIADFSISDMGKPQKNKFNFHLQNTSQWVFAGCLLVQDKVVSIHT